MKKLLFALLLALPAADAGALELLLEENRGESGTIGYVDIDRVFKEYSGTTGAREEFITEIKKREDALNARKALVFTLKAELAKLRQEREFALTLPSLLETQRSIAEASAATAAAAAAQAQAALALQAAAVQSSSGPVQASTAPALAPAAAPAAEPQPAAAPAPAASAFPEGLPGMQGIDMPGITKVPVSHFKFSVSTAVPEIDAALAKKEAELASKEEELRLAQRQSERELLEYESRKGELLLGRIYVALKELAIKEEVSVIVDKRSILYGQNAVDLTAKLLRKLEDNGL